MAETTATAPKKGTKVYSNSEKTDMVLTYGECKENLKNTLALYKEKYPERKQPGKDVLKRLLENLKEHGAFVKPTPPKPKAPKPRKMWVWAPKGLSRTELNKYVDRSSAHN